MSVQTGEFSSVDGAFAAHPHNAHNLTLAWPVDKLDPERVDAMMSGNVDAAYTLVGRSALALGYGLNVQAAPGTRGVISKNRLYVPVSIESRAEESHKRDFTGFLNTALKNTASGDYLHSRRNGSVLDGGRILHTGGLQKVDGDEIEHVIREHVIGLGDGKLGAPAPYRVGSDFLAVPPAPWKLLRHTAKLAQPGTVLDVALHGRRALTDLLDYSIVNPEDTFDSFTLGTVLVSPGPYTIRIDQVSSGDGPTVHKQIKGGAWLDAYRTMGLNAQIEPTKRGQQFEVYGEADTLRFGDAEVIMSVFKYLPDAQGRSKTPQNATVQIYDLGENKRADFHANGYDPARLLRPHVTDLLEAASDKNCAVIVTPKGITNVAETGSAKFNAGDMALAAASSGQTRQPATGGPLESLPEKLKAVGNNQRILVAPKLHPKDIPSVVEKGDVQVVLTEGDSIFTGPQHANILSLVRNGIVVARAMNGTIEKMHRTGLFANPANFARLNELDVVLSFLGGNKPIMGEALYDQIDGFMKRFLESGVVEAHNAGVITGYGPGVMEAVTKLGRIHTMMVLGSGINAPGQPRNLAAMADAEVMFDPGDIAPRQTIIDENADVSIYNLGGPGTTSESAEDITKTKLYQRLPKPNIVVDEPGLFDHLIAQYRLFGELKELSIAGNLIDLHYHPLVDQWVPRTVHQVKTYDEACALTVEFLKDPASYYQHIGIPREQFKIAYPNHLAKNAKIGRRVAEIFVEGAEKFISGHDIKHFALS